MLKLVIVENEESQISRLENYINRYEKQTGEKCIVSKYMNGVDFLSEYRGDIDAVFLDIMMPLENGMLVAEKLRKIDENVFIIFVTNMSQYAIEGYKVRALDFMVKPVEYVEFSFELKKISKYKELKGDDFIWITSMGITKRVRLSEIKYVEIIKHDVYVYTDKEVLSFRGTLKDLESKLTGNQFSRCHNCSIVNLHYVDHIDGDRVILSTGDKDMYISRTKRKQFLADLTAFIVANGGIAIKGKGGN